MTDKEKELFQQSVNEDELKGVSGGKCWLVGSDGGGSCSENFYVQSCSATVEQGSRCRSDDWCNSEEVLYKEHPKSGKGKHS